MTTPFVAVAGGTGGLGKLVAEELRLRHVAVKAIVRPKTDPARTEELRKIGVDIAPVDISNIPGLTAELTGAICVVSTLQGLRDVLITAQSQLLEAAVAAKVPRFIPSDFALDFALDFTKTKPGTNRNLDLHREFHPVLDKSGIAWTSILSGGFMDLLGGESPMVNHKKRKAMYVGSTTQQLDWTCMADVAAYTATVAIDPNLTPKTLRIAGDVITLDQIAKTESEIHGVTYSPSWMGSVGFMGLLSRTMRMFGGEDKIMPAWQGMQYMENMFSGAGKLEPLDNDRYPEVKWTKLADFLQNEKEREAKK